METVTVSSKWLAELKGLIWDAWPIISGLVEEEKRWEASQKWRERFRRTGLPHATEKAPDVKKPGPSGPPDERDMIDEFLKPFSLLEGRGLQDRTNKLAEWLSSLDQRVVNQKQNQDLLFAGDKARLNRLEALEKQLLELKADSDMYLECGRLKVPRIESLEDRVTAFEQEQAEVRKTLDVVWTGFGNAIDTLEQRVTHLEKQT